MLAPRAHRAFVLACASASLLVLPSAAHAAVTASQITSPADPTFVVFDQDLPAGTQQLTASGTSNGAPGDLVDISCIYGNSSATFASNVVLGAGGAFSVTAPSNTITDNSAPCRLRALPDGYSTGFDVFAFRGPRIASTYIDLGGTRAVTGGAPVVNDYNIGAVGLRAAADLEPFGVNGINDHYGLTPGFQELQYAGWRTAARAKRVADDGARNSIQVDGKNAWGSDSPPLFDYDGAGPEPNSAPSGFAGAATTIAHDAATGNIVVTESAPLYRCTDDSLPATAVKCPTALGTGVQLDRITRVTREGTQISVADTFVSTDGGAHAVRLEHYNETDDSDYPTWKFPTDADFGFFDDGDFVAGQPAPGTVQWRDGDPGASPGGSMTWLDPVAYFRFSDYDYLLDIRELAVPAGGQVAATNVYGASRTSSDLDVLSSAVEDQAGLPVLTIATPGNGAIVGASPVTVTGTARDNKGIASVTVNGAAAALAGEGYSAPVALKAGANTVTVVASDAAGNTVTAAITVTLVVPAAAPGPRPAVRRCVAPRIKSGSTQSAVKRALVAAGCKAASKVVLKTSAKVRKGRVISISRRAGTQLPADTVIKLNVSKGAKKVVKKRATRR